MVRTEAGRANRDVVRSTDGGTTWTRLLAIPSDLPIPDLAFVSIAVASTSANVVYVVRSDGTLFATSDGGGVWRQTSVPGAATLAVSPVDPMVIAVGGAQGVRVSRDGGQSFQTLLPDARQTTILGFEPWQGHRLYVGALGGMYYRSADDLTGATVPSLGPLTDTISLRELRFVANRPGRRLGVNRLLVASNGD